MNSSDFLDRLHDLPTVPKVVRELLESFRRDDATIDSIARLISSDPVIAAKVLRLANSAFYRRSRSIGNLHDAVMYIGLHAARTVALGAGLAGNVKCPAGFDRRAFWHYSLHTGVAARYLARLAGQDADAAFTVGLVHAIGEPLIYSALAPQLREIDRRAGFFEESRAAEEAAAFGFCFSDVSADLAERWRFPPEMVDAIRFSRQPHAVGLSDTAGFVALGARIAAQEQRERLPPRNATDLTLLQRLNLTPIAIDAMPSLAELSQGLEELVG